tara:strand:+ start:5330 stop:5869 length:540 start_codon:yes stop_codon:yes gene_type:complete
MGTLLTAIENSSIVEVESGPMIWRLKKISSADLARVGHAAIAMSQVMKGPTADDKKTDAEAATDALTDALNKTSSDQLETMARLKDAIIAAALIAVGDPVSGEWETVECVIDRDDGKPEDGKLWVGSIPSDIADKLFSETMSLATDGGAAVKRLQAFRETARNPTSNRPIGETLQSVAE